VTDVDYYAYKAIFELMFILGAYFTALVALAVALDCRDQRRKRR